MDALNLLKQDHSEVAALFKQFEEASDDEKVDLAGQICQQLTIHALIEEELLYPAARGVLEADDENLVDEATVEHASVKALIEQIESEGSEDELFEAKVTVLGEYVNHHVEEEEDELFPKLKEADIDLEALGEALATRKQELMTELGVSADDAVEPTEPDDKPSPPPAANVKTRSSRSGNGVPKG